MVEALQRRDFLKTGSGALAAALLPLGALADEAADKQRKIKKAMMYGTLSYKGSLVERFKALKEAGFDGVEPNSHMNQDAVVDALEQSGLKAASVCCATHWTKQISDPKPEVRQESVEGLVRALQDAKRYGATSVLFVPGVVTKDVNYDQCFERAIAGVRMALPVAKELGVKIAIENVWNNFITKPEQAKAFLDAIDSPHVGWHFDIGNCLRYGPAEDWIPVVGKRILKLHIKEWGRFKPDRGFTVKLLEGDNHWPAIMKALDAVGYEGWGISEQPGEQSRDAAALKDLSTRMDRIFHS
jgi:hexulose-6-phosphate isomerase